MVFRRGRFERKRALCWSRLKSVAVHGFTRSIRGGLALRVAEPTIHVALLFCGARIALRPSIGVIVTMPAWTAGHHPSMVTATRCTLSASVAAARSVDAMDLQLARVRRTLDARREVPTGLWSDELGVRMALELRWSRSSLFDFGARYRRARSPTCDSTCETI